MNIVVLGREHNRKTFDCGENSVNSFLREGALQDQERLLSKTRVLVDEYTDPGRILGFHTLLINLVDQQAIPNDRPRIKRKIPVLLLAQIGVDIRSQGNGFGDLLLTDAEIRTADVAATVGIRSLMLDARSEQLALWYEKRDFIRFPGSLRMFKSIASIRRLIR